MRFFAFLLFALFSLSALAKKEYIIYKSSSITVDGDLSDWNDIPETDEFIIHDYGTAAAQSTTAKLAWDDSSLYVAFKVYDSDLLTSSGQQDAQIFSSDDLVEFFIDPDGDGLNYLEVGVNAQDVYYDYIVVCPNASCGGWQDNQAYDLASFSNASMIKAGVYYTIEVKIAFSSLNNIPNGGFSTPNDGTIWNGNLFRIDRSNSATPEYQSWNPHNSFGYHQPDKFGLLTFKDESPSVTSNYLDKGNFEVFPNPTAGEIWFSKSVLSAEVIDLNGKPVGFYLTVEKMDLSHLPNGSYWLKLTVNEGVISRKIVVAK